MYAFDSFELVDAPHPVHTRGQSQIHVYGIRYVFDAFIVRSQKHDVDDRQHQKVHMKLQEHETQTATINRLIYEDPVNDIGNYPDARKRDDRRSKN